MNPEDAIAIQAMKARLGGSPMPQASQVAPQSGTIAPMAPTPNVNPIPQPNRQLGDITHKKAPTESDTLAKNIIQGTAHTDPHVQLLSKVLLQRLIPYLGKGGPAVPPQP